MPLIRLKSSRHRRAPWVALLILLLAVPFASLSGCAVPPPVPDNVEQAFKDGDAKKDDARKAEAAHDQTDATQKWNTVATYYGAVASKFHGTDNGLKAALEQADALENGAKNPQAAQMSLKNALKGYSPQNAPTEYPIAQQTYDELIKRVDEKNATTLQYKFMDALVRLFGNDVRYSPTVAVLAIAVIVTLVLWPLRVKQYQNMKEMQRWQPHMAKIQEKYKNDQQLLMQKQQQFYKDHNINQFAGCLPLLLQAPVTWIMYTVILNYQFRFANTHFLWITPALGDMSAGWPWPLSHAIGHNLGESDLFLLVIYAISMYLQSKFMQTTVPTDPAQAEQQKMMTVTMPIMFFIMMLQWQIASAFVLYWFASNALGLIQQQIIMKNLPDLPPLVIKSDDDSGPNNGVSVPNGGGPNSGTGEVKRPMTANKRLVSPKTRRRVQKK